MKVTSKNAIIIMQPTKKKRSFLMAVLDNPRSLGLVAPERPFKFIKG